MKKVFRFALAPLLTLGLAFLLFFGSNSAFGQDGGGESKGHTRQAGIFIGRVLPHGISSNDDIFTLWGVRYSEPVGKGDKAGGGNFIDAAFFGGNGSKVHWGGISIDFSLQAPIETLTLGVGLGIDSTEYSSDTTSTKFVVGEHLTTSIMSRVGSNALLRFDMKFNTNPGTTVFFGLGITFEFGGSDTGS